MRPSFWSVIGVYLSVAKKHLWVNLGTFVFYGTAIVLAQVTLPLISREIINYLAVTTPSAQAWPDLAGFVALIAVVVVLYNVFFRIAEYCIVVAQVSGMRELANLSFEALTRHSYTFFTNSFTGSLVTRVKRFVHGFEVIHDNLAFTIWFAVVQAMGSMIVFFWVFPLLGVLFFMWVVSYVAQAWLLFPRKRSLQLADAAADTVVAGRLADVLTGILNLKMFAARRQEIDSFFDLTEDLRRKRAASWHYHNVINLLQGGSMAILEISSMYLVLRSWTAGLLTTGDVVLVQSLLILVMQQLWELGRSFVYTSKAASEATEMVEIIKQPLEVEDPAQPEPVRMSAGQITFDAVLFAYKQGLTVFPSFSLNVPAGERVGIVGHSGAGKSTLFKLLLRFIDIQEGSITIDGQDITAVTQDDLRHSMSYVPQDPVLFHRSLYENIAYAKPEATQEEVVEVAKRAHAHEFISALPQGYQTLVGERGIKLSGGERQRVAIARAMLKDAPVLLLDEATSSLDSVSEKYIQENLKLLMEDRTVLAIAHRISTIQQMDRIIVLADGQIAEDGTHEALLKQGGIYAELWEHQSEGFIGE